MPADITCGLGARARHCLHNYFGGYSGKGGDIHPVRLTEMTADEFRRDCPHAGHKTVAEIGKWLASQGLAFRLGNRG